MSLIIENDLVLPNAEDEDKLYRGQLADLSYTKVQKHKEDSHPCLGRKRHWCCEKIESLPWPCALDSVKKKEWVNEPAKRIGLGASMFLMTNKAMSFMFAVLVLINIPLLAAYNNGDGSPSSEGGISVFLS